ncbi:hypothetical protein CORC01_10813 [Colletotrichum orchidophilum]|uniref:Uncharacterized protein n=1 Tax=Colletotrichum orchidophilum TaxID=1209926 RepID=A0A1G4AXP1_9PEZI|nr:uncharacterized protein CORC01_10813 [Colletotrichum orchidophilum]OHE93914.1 hypothetical protein CORC01_10813 [Colletotrichum orchidophilum]
MYETETKIHYALDMRRTQKSKAYCFLSRATRRVTAHQSCLSKAIEIFRRMASKPSPLEHSAKLGSMLSDTKVGPDRQRTSENSSCSITDQDTGCNFGIALDGMAETAEEDFNLDPAHEFRTWNRDKLRWEHKDEKTGSMTSAPGHLD